MTLEELNWLPTDIDQCLDGLISGFPNQIVFTTSLSKEDQVITHLLARKNIRIVTLDTGRHFPEIYDLLHRTQVKYGVKIDVFFPQNEAVESYVNSFGVNGFYNSVEARKSCCQIRKVEPLQRALIGARIWITGLRSEQSENRQSLQRFESQNGLVKYNPLADWSQQMLDAYIVENNIPVNSLHRKGFVSIGCAPCTRAIEPGEDPRSGRWWWETSKKECGIHKR